MFFKKRKKKEYIITSVRLNKKKKSLNLYIDLIFCLRCLFNRLLFFVLCLFYIKILITNNPSNNQPITSGRRIILFFFLLVLYFILFKRNWTKVYIYYDNFIYIVIILIRFDVVREDLLFILHVWTNKLEYLKSLNKQNSNVQKKTSYCTRLIC